jgi:TldD protein
MDLADDLKIFDNDLIADLNRLAQNSVDYWDIRASINKGTTIDFVDQKSKEISFYELNDCGIRSFVNGGWGFNVLKSFDKKSIKQGMQKSIKLAKLSESLVSENFKIKEIKPITKQFHNQTKINLKDVDIEEKIKLVKNHEKIASNYSDEIKNTHTIYMDGIKSYLFLNSFNSYIYQHLSLVRLLNIVFSNRDGLIQNSRNSIGGIGGFEIMDTENANKLSEKTAKEAIALLDAKSPKGGNFTIIADPKLTGTIIHEAFGHACEADLVLNKESILENKIGKKLANSDINIVDEPTMGQGNRFNLPYELYGCYFMDDEGVPSQKTIIIENGILKNYLHNLETASRMESQPNGHGRASSSSSRPQVRMGYIYLEPKDWNIDEMIRDTKNGILCRDFLYGYTNTTTGNFQFKCKFSYKIENGEIKEMMRDVALSGMILEVLKKISAIGNSKSFYYSDGMCGKGGQRVRVCDGAPYIRINNITVGGLN